MCIFYISAFYNIKTTGLTNTYFTHFQSSEPADFLTTKASTMVPWRNKYSALKFGIKKRSLRNTIEHLFFKGILLYVFPIGIKKIFGKSIFLEDIRSISQKVWFSRIFGGGGKQLISILITDLDRPLVHLPMVKILDRVLGKFFLVIEAQSQFLQKS
jgi:hypothetical protein